MAFLEINPFYEALCRRLGLTTVEAFLRLPGVVVTGHPDRHVARVTLDEGPGAIHGFLKRQHRVRFKERLGNALQGFGFVSKSAREAAVLQRARAAGVSCPDWIALGEDLPGCAFLLLREENGMADLRDFLHAPRSEGLRERRKIAKHLGTVLARAHQAGLTHPDLYAKHLLIDPTHGRISILDWQRSHQRKRVSWAERWRDLAALAATVPEDWAGPGEQLACLRAYLRATTDGAAPGVRADCACPQTLLRSAVRAIQRQAARLLRQRRIREQRRAPIAGNAQRLVWLDGEALCVSVDLNASLCGWLPEWLVLDNLPPWPARLLLRETVATPLAQQALLSRRRNNRPLARTLAWIRGRAFTSPELRQAGLLFRLERYGIRTPRLLAFGQRLGFLGQVESFVLVERLPGTMTLSNWLRRHGRPTSGSRQLSRHRQLILEAARLLRDMHDAQCALGDASPLQIQKIVGEPPSVVLTGVEGLRPLKRGHGKGALADLRLLHRAVASSLPTRSDGLRFLCGYFGVGKLTPALKTLARSVAMPGSTARLVRRIGRSDGLTRHKVIT
jgi:hypothetical protein